MDRRLLSEKTIGAVILLTAGLTLTGSAEVLATLAWVIIGLETVSLSWISRPNAAITSGVLAATAIVVAILELLASRGQEFSNQQIGLLAAGAGAFLLLLGASRTLRQTS
jgi:hypothetical protein